MLSYEEKTLKMEREIIYNADLHNTILIMGVCTEGPYRYAEDNLRNPEVRWISWGYSSEYITQDVLQKIKYKEIQSKTEVVFASWNIGIEKRAKLLRKGVIDHIVYKEDYLGFTVFLKEVLFGFIEISEKDHYLCRYIELTQFMR
jgi:hypothetical protein